MREVKRFISENPEILITRADKGNTTVIMNRESYRRKMYEKFLFYIIRNMTIGAATLLYDAPS